MDAKIPLSLLTSAFPFVYFTEAFADVRDFGNARIEFCKNALDTAGKPDNGKPTTDELLRGVFASAQELNAFYASLLKEGRVENREICLKSGDKARMSSRLIRLRPGLHCLQGYFSGITRHAAAANAANAKPAAQSSEDPGAIIGTSRAMENVAAAVAKIGPLNIPVLLKGEPGTGRHHIARAIHSKSPRAKRPFVAVHCDAYSETLLESELFGHTQGAFAGADDECEGLIEKADGGSVYLDEVGALPLSVQFKLLLLLKEGEIRRMGSLKSLRVDVRLIAGCQTDLDKKAADKAFNEELYRRFQLFALKVPPLREREDDVLLLADHFLKRLDAASRPKISRSAALLLKRHRWPGNVRELKSTVERAALLCENGMIGEEHLPLAQPEKPAADLPQAASIPAASRDEGARQRILACLEKNRWNKTRTARDLNISRATLWRKIKELAIPSS